MSPARQTGRSTHKTLRAALLKWYSEFRRDLPWRRSRDPYAIWVSETMLQQTRVDTVIPYYERFLERFPDLEALASADQDEVYGQWAGLGYYSRARNLHAAAKVMVEQHASRVPQDSEDLLRLPGVGRYTAGAVASIAFDRAEAVVDGNVARILSRILGLREDVKSAPMVTRLWEEAAALVRGPQPGDLNQALMELGATVCTPRKPACDTCPVSHWCDARRAGDAEALPVKRKKQRARKVVASAAWVERRGKLLAVRREAGGLLGGLWGPPGRDLENGEEPAALLRAHLDESLGLAVDELAPLGQVRHLFTHRSLTLHVYHCHVRSGRTRRRDYDAHQWASSAQLAALPRSSLADKALGLLEHTQNQTGRKT